MQTGNLKSFTPDVSKKKYGWLKWFNPLTYLPHSLYREFLEAYVGHPRVATYYYYHTFPDTHELPLYSAIKVKEVKQCKAKVEELNFDSTRRISRSLDFASTKIDIKSGLNLSYKVKWILLNFKRILQLKTANIHLWKKPKMHSFMNFDLKNRLTKKLIPPEVFKIDTFANSKGILVELKPYVQGVPIAQLYEIPIEKPAMNKNFIALPLLEKFKNHLSSAAQVKPTEVKVINAYENMHIEVYKDIKHNAQKNILMCYLDASKNHIRKPKNYYLVFGQRLADQKMFTIVCEG